MTYLALAVLILTCLAMAWGIGKIAGSKPNPGNEAEPWPPHSDGEDSGCAMHLGHGGTDR